MNIALLKLNEEVTRLEANMAQTKLEIMFAKHAHALKELEAAQAGDTPAEEAKPTAAAKKKAAGKKAAADVEKVQAAADKAVAKQTAEAKAKELEDAVGLDEEEEADELSYTEGKLNVLGKLGNLRHLGKSDRAPYICDLDLKIDHTKAKANGVVYADLVNEIVANLDTEAPVGTAKVPTSDGMKKAIAVIGQELVDHMATRVDQATFVGHIKALYKLAK